MKKIITLMLIIVAMVACKKEYSCTCTSVWNNGQTSDPQHILLEKQKKSDAKTDCESRSGAGSQATLTCQLD